MTPSHTAPPTLFTGAAAAVALARDIAAASSRIDAWLYSAAAPTLSRAATPRDGYDAIITALRAAARAGRTITLSISAPITRHAATTRARDAAAALRRLGARVRLATADRPLHAKIWLIDQKIVWTGSANLTPAAYRTNAEASLRIESAVSADKIDSLLGAMYLPD